MGVNLDNLSGLTTGTDGIPAAPAGDNSGTPNVVTLKPAPVPKAGDGYKTESKTTLPVLNNGTTGQAQSRHGDKPQYTIPNAPTAITTSGPDLPPQENVPFEGAMALVANVSTYGETGTVSAISEDFQVEPEENRGAHEVLSVVFNLMTQALRGPSGGADFDPSSELDDPNFDPIADMNK